MVSGFLCPCHGLLRLTDDHVFSELECDCNITVIINPGVNKDGYFTNEDLADQTNRMMQIFDILHPGCTGLMAFDNSSNHHAMAKNVVSQADSTQSVHSGDETQRMPDIACSATRFSRAKTPARGDCSRSAS